MDIKSKKLKIRNLPQGNKEIGCINSKPYGILIFILIVSILFLVIYKSILIGLVLFAFSFYNICFIRNEKIVQFFDEYVVFYFISSSKDECYIMFWKDIASWKIVKTKSAEDVLEVVFKNGETIQLRCICHMKIRRYFNKQIHLSSEKDSKP